MKIFYFFSEFLKYSFVCLILADFKSIKADENETFEKGPKNKFGEWVVPIISGNQSKRIYLHSVSKSDRAHSDCYPNCPKVKIWQYQYKPLNQNVITDNKPIASRKEFWKVPYEARIIAMTLFGNSERYLIGLEQFLDSFEHIKRINKVKSSNWGFDSFTLRVYVAKRDLASKLQKDELKNATSHSFIDRLLARGVEIAYVDNEKDSVGLDGTFWRFMVAAEKMPENHRIRYLIRDVDWKLTAAEVFAVGQWIDSGKLFHRFNAFPICIGPVVAGMWGGVHVGPGLFEDLKSMIENFPYRRRYGDDELFLRDRLWPLIKESGSVLTHKYPRGLAHVFASPDREGCEEPTAKYCSFLNKSHQCMDVEILREIPFPVMELAKDKKLNQIDDKYFRLNLKNEHIQKALKAYETKEIRSESTISNNNEEMEVVPSDDNESAESILKMVVIPTFDDGPLNRDVWRKFNKACPSESDFLRPLRSILNLLKSRNIIGVFYVTGWANIDLDSSCVTRTEEALRSMFQTGLKEISEGGHIIGLHAFNHEKYQPGKLSASEIVEDLEKLIIEIRKAGIEPSRVWRTPYGSHGNIQESLQAKLKLQGRMWHLDSADAAAHDDSPVRIFFKNDFVWKKVSNFWLMYRTRFIAPDLNEEEPFNDVLFHINERTGRYVGDVLDNLQYYLEYHKLADFGPDGNYTWVKSKKDPGVINYVGPYGKIQ